VHWRIDAHPTGGLQAISEIPDISPCLIEGPNGIGKTVAIQLLQLASGTVPSAFTARPELWKSFRDRLGNAELTGSGLNGATDIQLKMVPSQWPDQPVEPSEWIGECRIDGARASFADLSSLLDVNHISGTEDLVQTLARHIETFEGHLRDVSGLLRKRHLDVRGHAGPAIELLSRFEPGQSARDHDAVVRCDDNLVSAIEAARQADDSLRALMRGIELLNKVASLDADADALLSQRRAVAARVAELEQRLEDARANAETLSSAVAAQGDAGRRLAAGQRLLRTRSARAAKTRAEMEAEAFVLDLEPNQSAISRAKDDCLEQVGLTRARLTSLDTAGEVREVVEQTLGLLSATSDSVRDEELAQGFEPRLTVRAALDALGATSRSLRDQPTPAEVRELNSRVNDLAVRLRTIDHLGALVEQAHREEELADEAEQDLVRLEEEADDAGASSEASKEAQQSVGALENELGKLRIELAALDRAAAARGMVSREDAELDLLEIEDHLGVLRTEWLRVEPDYRRNLARADEEVMSATTSLDQARRRQSAHSAETAELVRSIATDDRFAWMLTVEGGDSTAPLADRLERVKAAVNEAVSLPDDLADLMLTLQGVAQSVLQRGLNDSPLLDSSRHLIKPLRRVLGARLTATLNTPAIRARVFENATITDIDPADGTVSLMLTDGSADIRALASYSTGEQAFAFTQARIADIEPSAKPNRLLFLDEFGAFVSADRMPDLAAFLSSDIVKQVAEQVIVVLPLQVDYEAELEDTRGSLRAKYEERSRQIKQRGYSAVELS